MQKFRQKKKIDGIRVGGASKGRLIAPALILSQFFVLAPILGNENVEEAFRSYADAIQFKFNLNSYKHYF